MLAGGHGWNLWASALLLSGPLEKGPRKYCTCTYIVHTYIVWGEGIGGALPFLCIIILVIKAATTTTRRGGRNICGMDYHGATATVVVVMGMERKTSRTVWSERSRAGPDRKDNPTTRTASSFVFPQGSHATHGHESNIPTQLHSSVAGARQARQAGCWSWSNNCCWPARH